MARDSSGKRCLVSLWLLPAILATAGCGAGTPEPDAQAVRDAADTGGTVEPSSAEEQKVLDGLSDLAPGKTHNVGSLRVVADRPYFAASGRTCRRVTMTPGSGKASAATRLACTEGQKWFFVPDVFRAPTGNP